MLVALYHSGSLPLFSDRFQCIGRLEQPFQTQAASVQCQLGFSFYSFFHYIQNPFSKAMWKTTHIKCHFYSDCTQLYIHLTHKNATKVLG